MGITPELWRKNIREALEWIADEHHQREVWVPGTSYWDHADEAICTLFDDDQFPLFIESPVIGLTGLQRSKAIEVRDAVDRLIQEEPGSWSGSWLVDDPRWIHIRKLAKELLDLL